MATSAGTLAVTDAGSGPAVVLVHVGAWGFLWRDVVRALAPSHRCIVVDAPGTGLSTRCGDRVTLTQAATGLRDVLDHLDLRAVTLAVHDLGGPAGLAAAADRPDRIGAVAAVNTFAWQPGGAAFRSMLAVMGSAPLRATDGALGWLPRATSTRFGAGRRWDRSDRATFRRGIDPAARRAWHDYFADARRADDLYAAIERALAGPLADLPVLTVFGEHNDPLGFQPQWRARFPHARQEVVTGGLHFPMCDAPDLVARLLAELALEARAPGPPSPEAGAPPVIEPPQQEPGGDR